VLREQFARNVRNFRKQKQMTQLDLAASAGVGRTFISQIERGHFSVTLETIAAIAGALAVPPAALIGTGASHDNAVARESESYSRAERGRRLADRHG
jgi:transcriptional regulator with XRE-family HTH domain